MFAAFVLQNVQMHSTGQVLCLQVVMFMIHVKFMATGKEQVQDEAEDGEERGSGSFKQIPFQSQKVFERRSIK